MHGAGDVDESQLRADDIADRWGDLLAAQGSDRASLGYEFTLFLLRNPEARERVSSQREETAHALADYIAKGVARLGGQLTMEAVDLARVVLAANDGVTLNSLVDGRDVYRPFLRMVIANIVAPPSK